MSKVITSYIEQATTTAPVTVAAVPVPAAPAAVPAPLANFDVNSYELKEDLGFIIQRLQNEYVREDEQNNTGMLTEQQKALVPLISQAASAFILAEKLEDLTWIMRGIAEKLGVDKNYVHF